MTLTRRLALRIAEFVARHSSSAAQEWADGGAREVEFIDGDWAALGWALGSMRVLLSRRGARNDASSLSPTTTRLVNLANNAAMMCFQIHYAVEIISSSDLFVRVGSSFILLGWLYWDFAQTQEWAWERKAPPTEDIRETALYRMEKLQRRLRNARPARRITPTLVTVGFFSGYILTFNMYGVTSIVLRTMTVAACAFVIRLLWLDSPAKVRSSIARFEARAAEEGWFKFPGC